MKPTRCLLAAAMLHALLAHAPTARAADWPQWRYDAPRSAASPAPLPDNLALHWSRSFGRRVQAWDDPATRGQITYDKTFEPVVLDGRLFLPFNDSDKLLALDAATGRELWRFYTDGPLRLPPAAWDGKIYLAGDDGYLYCLAADSGKLLWSFRLAPSAHKCLGNERLISMWPCRGGPVVRDGVVYVAAGIWPFLGTFLYALDARSGQPLWTNDRTGAIYALQGHAASAFATVAPQGALAATESALFVPGGRTLPAVFNRRTGLLAHFDGSGISGGGGSFVAANEKLFFSFAGESRVALYDHSGKPTGRALHHRPVLDGDTMYVYGGPVDADKPPRPVVQAIGPHPWEIAADAAGDLIKAGPRLYAAGKDRLVAIDIPSKPGDKPRISWSCPVTGQVLRLIAAADRLFAVTLDGSILCFGPSPAPELKPEGSRSLYLRVYSGPPGGRREPILDHLRGEAGYALCFNVDEYQLGGLTEAPGLHVVAVDSDPAKVAGSRAAYERDSRYGSKFSAHAGTPETFRAPPYFASVVVIGPNIPEAAVRESVRPFGGTLWRAEPGKPAVLLWTRNDLPGSADWTGLYGGPGNTLKSDDSLVKLPLGVLWFGGNTNLDVLPRHGRGPTEQVAAGRLVIQGEEALSARDVYTGRVLWKYPFPQADKSTFGVYFDQTRANQAPMMGASARGTNYTLTADKVYLALADGCHVLDAATGKRAALIPMPSLDAGAPNTDWGYIGVHGDLLLGGAGFVDYSAQAGKPLWNSFNATMDKSASRGLRAFDRRTGKLLWTARARHGFIHNAIAAGGGRVYCLDKLPAGVEDALARRGRKGEGYRIVALDAATGKELWTQSQGLFGTFLSYSEKHDILLESLDANNARPGGMVGTGLAAWRGRDGMLLWRNPDFFYNGPVILWHDLVLTNTRYYAKSSGAIDLRTGKPALVPNPVTARPEPWLISRAYGCGSMIAAENLLTFRSGSAAYYDLAARGGTGSLGGFRSGCTANLVIADGVLNAPDYTRTCSCAFQNQTSLGLVHMPDLKSEVWTAHYDALNYWDFNDFEPMAVTDPVRRVGLNFGAPGDWTAPDGTLWLEWPAIGGASYALPVEYDGRRLPPNTPASIEAKPGAPDTFRRSHAFVDGELPQVTASCARGIRGVTVDLNVGRRTHTIPLASNADDASEAAGKVALDAPALTLGQAGGKPQLAGLRFANVPLAREARIESAYIQFTAVRGEPGKDTESLTVRAQASDDAPAFTRADRDLSARPPAAATIPWRPGLWNSPNMGGLNQRTADLTPLLRELLARPGWRSGQAMAFLVAGRRSLPAHARDGRGDLAPYLRVVTRDNPAGKPAPTFTVTLYFAELEGKKPGQRTFDVMIQGRTVLTGFDPVAAAGAPNRGIRRTFAGIPVADRLRVEFRPAPGSATEPILSGLEIVAENGAATRAAK